MDFSYIRTNIEEYKKQFHQLAWKWTFVVVTKHQDRATTQACIDLWIQNIAESRIDTAIKKKQKLTGNFTYHMIWHVQTNKVKKAVACFDVIQSVDSIKLLTHIQKHAKEQQKHITILLQINATNEPQKYGFSIEEIHEAIQLTKHHPFVSLAWCMCMWKASDKKTTTEAFIRTKEICTKYTLPLISCWMTEDRKTAVAVWSTMVRIWSWCFN